VRFAAVRGIAEGTTSVNQNRGPCGTNEKQRVALTNIEYVQFDRTALPVWREGKRCHRMRRAARERKADSLDPLCWNRGRPQRYCENYR